MAAAGFLSHYLSVRRHITGDKNVLSASLNKTFPSFLSLRSIGTKEIFYLMTHSPHLRILGDGHIVKDSSDSKKGNPLPLHHGYSFRLAAKDILHVPLRRQDSTYHDLCYTNCVALAGTRNISVGPL